MMFFCHCYKYITTENFLRIMSDEIVLCLPRKMFNTYFFLQYLILHYVNLKIREPNKCKSICMLLIWVVFFLIFLMLLSIFSCCYQYMFAITTTCMLSRPQIRNDKSMIFLNILNLQHQIELFNLLNGNIKNS